jgi:hypothetical protein
VLIARSLGAEIWPEAVVKRSGINADRLVALLVHAHICVHEPPGHVHIMLVLPVAGR